MVKNHHEELARLIREAATALDRVNEYWVANGLPDTFSTGLPFSMSLEEQVYAIGEWASKLEEQERAEWFAERKAKPFVQCSNPLHDHTTTDDGRGGEFPEPVPLWCHYCGAAAHYDQREEWYGHDDAPDCFHMQRGDDATPCVLA